jgi:hypothetical protein
MTGELWITVSIPTKLKQESGPLSCTSALQKNILLCPQLTN